MSTSCGFHTFDRDRFLALFARPTEAQRASILELADEIGGGCAEVARRLLGKRFDYADHPPSDHALLDRLFAEVICHEELADELGAEQRGYVHYSVPQELALVDPDARWTRFLADGRRLGDDAPPERVVFTVFAPDELAEVVAQVKKVVGKKGVGEGLREAVREELLPALERARKAKRWFLAEVLDGADQLDEGGPDDGKVFGLEPEPGTADYAILQRRRGDHEGAYRTLVEIVETERGRVDWALSWLPDVCRRIGREKEIPQWKRRQREWSAKTERLERERAERKKREAAEAETLARADVEAALARGVGGAAPAKHDSPDERLATSAKEYSEMGYTVSWNADRASFTATPPARLSAFGAVTVKRGDV